MNPTFKTGINALLNPRVRSRSQALSKMYGGKWKYDGMATWNCDDGVRSVVRTCGCSGDSDRCTCLTNYYLYGAGNAEAVFF